MDIGQTPLHIAAFYDRENIVKLLIQNGADLEARTNCGNCGSTPLHAAIDAHPGNTAALLH